MDPRNLEGYGDGYADGHRDGKADADDAWRADAERNEARIEARIRREEVEPLRDVALALTTWASGVGCPESVWPYINEHIVPIVNKARAALRAADKGKD